jgi:heme/copper-type cytochrome/quinol oxidase subunit 2
MINRFTLTIYSFFLTAMSLLAQMSSGPVNSPQRGTTHAEDASGGSTTLIILSAIFIVVLVTFLLLRRKNAPTRNRLHKY